METKNIKNKQIFKIKSFYKCRSHINHKYTAYCSTCKLNICDKCLNKNSIHIGHVITFYEKIFLTENQIQYYKTLFVFCQFYLHRIREIVIELYSDLTEFINKTDKNNKNYPLLLKYRKQLKNTYKNFYKINIYQRYYAKKILELYFYYSKNKIINYQMIENIYNIKINSVKIPDLEGKDLFTKTLILINFMKDNKNYFLKASDSEFLSTIYSYRDCNNGETSKVKTYNVKLSYIAFDLNKFEIYEPNQNSYSDESKSIETDDTVDIKKKQITDIVNEYEIVSKQYLQEKEIIFSPNIKKKEDSPNKTKLIHNIKTYRTEQINDSEEKNYNINPYNEMRKALIKQYQEINNKYKLKNNLTKENRYIKIINIEEKKKEIEEKYKIKNLIFSNLKKLSNEEVVYRSNIKYIYFDEKEKREINGSYHGEYKKGTYIRHGRGLFIWGDGEYYLGYWANDKREGEGTNTYPNGNVYNGYYKNGKKEGDGIYEWKNGDKYEGKWKNDMKDGKGIYYYSNGDIYDGFFKMDKMDGNGSYTWANNIMYKGVFKNNLIENKNYITFPKSDIINIHKIKIRHNKSKEEKAYIDIFPSSDIDE